MTAPGTMLVCASGALTGAELLALEVARARASAGDRVSLACRPGPLAAAARRTGVEVLELPFRKAYDARSAAGLRRGVRSGGHDVVHSFNEIADVAVAVGCAGVPVRWITTQTNLASAGRAKRWVHGRLVGRATVISAVSQDLAERWEAATGRRVARTPSIARIPAAPAQEVSERAAATPTRVTMIGRMSRQKGVDVFVRAAAPLCDAGLECVFIGDDPDGDDVDAVLRAEVLAENERLGRPVRFQPRIAADQVPAALEDAGLLAFPSRWEGLPMTLLEAMALGVPVAATAYPGVAQLVRDGETGLLVAPEAADELAAALLRLAGDGGLRRRLALAARELVVAEHGPGGLTAAWESLYRTARAAA